MSTYLPGLSVVDHAVPETEPSARWRWYLEVKPDRPYVVLLTRLELISFWRSINLPAYGRLLEAELASARSLVGFSLLPQSSRLRFWSLSIWRNERTLQDFTPAFCACRGMQALTVACGRTRFLHWSVDGEETPPRWKDALSRWTLA